MLERAAPFDLPKAESRPSYCGTGTGLPPTIFRFIRETGPFHQALLCVLTVAIFLLEFVPLELQRRIVNDLVEKRDFGLIVLLSGTYGLLAFGQGALKLGLNVYRGWVGEQATRDLRMRINGAGHTVPTPDGSEPGIKVSMIVAEVEPIGGFVGQSISEPLLQTGVLFTVLVYMFSLQPVVALAMLAIFFPQLVFVPMMQRAINRRAASRVGVLRKVSSGIIGSAQNGDTVDGQVDRVFQLNMGIFRLKFTMNFLMNLSHHLQIVAALLFCGWCVLNGQGEVGTLVAFISAVSRLNDPWGDLVNYFRDLTATTTKYRLLVNALEEAEHRASADMT